MLFLIMYEKYFLAKCQINDARVTHSRLLGLCLSSSNELKEEVKDFEMQKSLSGPSLLSSFACILC